METPSESLVRWRRDPLQRFLSIDRKGSTRTYSRSCTASREFVLVRVPVDPLTQEEVLTALDEDQRRFVVHNMTPRELCYA